MNSTRPIPAPSTRRWFAAPCGLRARIHPFADGNGACPARRQSPALRTGLPPVLIPLERRAEYIELLARWQIASGRPKPASRSWATQREYEAFVAFCREVTRGVDELIGETRQCQESRRARVVTPQGLFRQAHGLFPTSVIAFSSSADSAPCQTPATPPIQPVNPTLRELWDDASDREGAAAAVVAGV